MKRNRQQPQVRRQAIISACLRLAVKTDYRQLKRAQIARAVGCSTNLITHHFRSMDKLRHAVMSEAIEQKNLCVISQGLIAKNRQALSIPEQLRKAAITHLLPA